MPRLLFPLLLLLVAFAPSRQAAAQSAKATRDGGPLRVLMMTGQNNHDWKATTPVLKEIIEADGRFTLTIDKKPWELGPDGFKGYDVLFSNWSVWPDLKNDPWSSETKAAFLKHISEGNGLLVMHAGSSVHYQWPEFQALVGRTWRQNKTWHAAKHSFLVSATGEHPITNGVEPFEIFDELWRDMDPTGEYQTLMTADTSKDARKQGPAEPMLLTTKLGKGRGVNLVLGHDTRSLANKGFQQVLVRSLEWAASGKVSAKPTNVDSKPGSSTKAGSGSKKK